MNFVCGKIPSGARAPGNVYVVNQPGDGQTSCKVWLAYGERCRCSNEAKTQTRNPLKFAGMPQTGKLISAANRPKFTILSEHVDEVLLFNNFFPIVDAYLSCGDMARQICAMVLRWRFFASCIFSEPVQHVSDLRPKFALRPHHVWRYDRHPISDG